MGTQVAFSTPDEVSRFIADRARALRLIKGWKRDTLAGRAGVSAGSLKRFESTGKASLELVLKISHALGRLDEFARLLEPPDPRSMADLEERSRGPERKRGRL
jgi:HTH-type transcriptional regulator / antitoxin HipB